MRKVRTAEFVKYLSRIGRNEHYLLCERPVLLRIFKERYLGIAMDFFCMKKRIHEKRETEKKILKICQRRAYGFTLYEQ